MNIPTSTGYRLRVEPISGTVRALRGGDVVAESDRAKIMFETRLPPAVYFPEADVSGLGDVTDSRTFCPFKGTATYHDLHINGEQLKNAAWRYPNALPESKPIENFIGFMPGIIDHMEADHGLPSATEDGNISSPIVDWLMREAWLVSGPQDLTRDLAHAFLDAGIAVSRLQVTLWSLHPLIAGVSYTWEKQSDQVRVYEARHETLSHPSMYNSPIRWVSEGLGGVRQPLTTDQAEFDFPIMQDLRRKGATDYVAMPLPFSTGRINVLTMACDHPEGFTTANLGLVFECAAVISRHYEVHSQQTNARTLLGTFLGRRTGERVLGGEIRRGDGEEIQAAVLFCDLRDSSRLATDMDKAAYLELLNDFFEAVSRAVDSRGGEVLKFIGDAVLAVFPAEAGRTSACEAAVSSARKIQEAVNDISGPDGEPPRAASGISFGHVTYGNVGSRDRLDFTVIGEAANIAARLSDLCKTLGETTLIDTRPDEMTDDIRDLGAHTLHNISVPVEVWGIGARGQI